MKTFGILVGGGPAPGINGVIAAATIVARHHGAKVLGILEGYRWLIEGDTSHVRELSIDVAEQIQLEGGSAIKTSRANPTRNAAHLEAVVKGLDGLGIDHLITIGGDDSATSAASVAAAAEGRIRVVHVPKTIDNDLPLPEGIPTFGFETAREKARDVLTILLEDARTAPRWYIAILMGRNAGFLTSGAGKSAGVPLVILAEDFERRPVPLEILKRTIEGAMMKRAAVGRPFGVAAIAEGVTEILDPADLEILEGVDRDEHGHIRLAEVPLGKLLRDEIRSDLGGRGIKVGLVEKDVGYEVRCARPNGFDSDYTGDLGAGAARLLLQGTSSVMVSRQQGRIVPIPFTAFIDPETGRSKTRMVDTATDSYLNARALQERLEPQDLEDVEMLAAIADHAGLSPDEAKTRYAVLFE